MSNGTFDFKNFVRESGDLLINPKNSFSSMKTSGGIAEPLIRSVIYGAVAGLIAMIWSVLNVGAMSGGLFGGSFGVMIFVSYIIGSIILLFVGGVILLVISSICNGTTDYEANVRVIAAVMVVMPIAAFLGFTGVISPLLGSVINLGINIFSLWLLYNGLVEALKAKPETSRIVMYILAALFVLFMIISIGVKNRANELYNDYKPLDQQEQVDRDKE